MEKDEIFEDHLQVAIDRAAVEFGCTAEELLAKIEFIDGDLDTTCRPFGAIYSYVDVWTVEYVAQTLTEKCNDI